MTNDSGSQGVRLEVREYAVWDAAGVPLKSPEFVKFVRLADYHAVLAERNAAESECEQLRTERDQWKARADDLFYSEQALAAQVSP